MNALLFIDGNDNDDGDAAGAGGAGDSTTRGWTGGGASVIGAADAGGTVPRLVERFHRAI